MNKLLLLILGLTLLLLDQPEDFQSKTMDPTELQVLKEVVMVDTIPTIYFKTIVSDLNQPLARHLFYLNEFNLCRSVMNLESIKLSEEERLYIVDRFATMEAANINKLIKEPKNFTLKQLKGHTWNVVSLPVVFRDGEFAIYYSKGAYSGHFVLMKNIDGDWRDVCYSSVWSE